MKKNISEEAKVFPKTKMQWLWENMEGKHVLYIIALMGTVAYNIMQLVVPYFSGRIVDEYVKGENVADNWATRPEHFYYLVAAMVGLTLLRVIIVYLDCMGYEVVSQSVLYKVRNKVYDKIQRQDMKFYNTYRTGDLMTRVTGDLDAVRHMVAWVIRVIIESFVLYAAAMVFFFVTSWQLAICMLVMSPIIFGVIYAFRKKVAPMHALLREKFAWMNTLAQENISGNRVVKAFAREEYEIDKFDVSNQDYRETNTKTSMVWLKFFPIVEGVVSMMPVVVLILGGLMLMNPESGLTFGKYFSFTGLIWAIQSPMRMMGNIMNEFQRFSAASNKVMEIYYSEPEIVDAPDAIDHLDKFEGKIEFKNVSFKYPDGNLPVLENISFTAEPGQTIAIMGETGCGKSSLINLIPRFYEPTEGEILIDGIDISTLKLKQLRQRIGLAAQDVLLYSDTIEGNIAYGNPDISLERVMKYAKYSAAAGFISKMPEGYDTIVGERGVGLSGGQKQRISLSRALAVEPSILILDDTTSAVDMETEKEIQESLRNLDFPCTKIIIAQRISTTKTADKILILDHGKITESGSHEELIAKKGYYYELVKLQTGEEM